MRPRQIPVFSAEREAGLADLVRSTASVSYAALAEVVEPFELSKRVQARLQHRTVATNEGQPDLHYLKSILVSTGWNKNDDVFDRIVAWVARHTPEDKQVNFEHKQDDIIGHITASYVVDVAGKIVADDTVADDLPAKFHIVTPAVLYKVWEDDALQERMDRILAEMAEGKWYVSMEALFANFDYALVDKDGTQKVVARNNATAFLTKHLRAYGGNGVYQDAKIGRLLQNVTFSGKGLVQKPANPESIIFTDAEPFQAATAEIFPLSPKQVYGTATRKDTAPTEEIENLMTPEVQKALETRIAELTNQLTVANDKLALSNTKELTAKAATLEAAVAARDERITKLEGSAKASTEELTSVKAALEASTKSLAETKAQLDLIASKAKRAERIGTIAKSLELTEAKATELADKLAKLDDETFAATIKTQAEYLAEKKAEYQASNKTAGDETTEAPKPTGPVNPPTGAKAAPKATDKPAPMTGKPEGNKVGTITTAEENDPAATNADPAVLDNAVPNREPALATEAVSDGVAEVQKSVAAYIGEYLNLATEK